MAKTKKKLLDVNNRVLLYLSTIPDISSVELDAPFSITQKGIASNIGISRRNIPRAVNFLMDEQLVESKKAHITGLKQKRSIYFLTPRGYSKAAEINLGLSKMNITLIETDGSEKRCDLKDIPSMIPDIVNYNDIVRDTEYSILDLNKSQEKIIKIDMKYLDFSNTFFKPRFVFGREEEKAIIDDWYKENFTRTLVITGIAGIGKTTLIADQINDMKKHHIICIKIHQWSTIRNIVTALADFLTTLGHNEINNYLKSRDTLDISELHILLDKSVKNLDLLMIFEDCHNMIPGIQQFFQVLYESIRGSSNAKMVAIGRSVPSFYDRRAVLNNKEVKELHLEGLDKESCKRILEEHNMITEHSDEIYYQTKGHPFFIELSGGQDLKKSGNIKKFLFEAFYSHLDKKEKDLLEYISVIRYPVEEDIIYPRHDELCNLLGTGVLREMADGRYEMHDLLKDFLYRTQGMSKQIKNHSLAAEYYLEENGPKSTLEAIYHRVRSKQFDLATELIEAHGRSIIMDGNSGVLCSHIGKVLASYSDISSENKVRMLSLMAEALSIIGEWDQALEHYEYVVELGTELERVPELAIAHLGIGKIHQRRHGMDEANAHFQSALGFYTEAADKRGIAEVNYQLGVLHERAGEYDKALRMFRKCERIGGNIGNSLVLAKAYNASGRIYNLKGKYEKAMKEKEKALGFLEGTAHNRELAKIYIGLGTCAFNIENIDRAIKYYTTASETAEEVGDLRILAHALSNLASAYFEKPNLIIAKESLDKAREIFMMLDMKKMLGAVYLNYAIFYIYRDDKEKIIEYFDKSINLFENIGSLPDMARAKHRYAQYYKDTGNLTKAKELYKESMNYFKRIDADTSVKTVSTELADMKSESLTNDWID